MARGKVAVYARQSSGTTWSHGKSRQVNAAVAGLKSAKKITGKKGVKTVGEIVSGCLPLKDRKKLSQLMDDSSIESIGVESLRALARKADVGEEIFKVAKSKGKDGLPPLPSPKNPLHAPGQVLGCPG